MNLKNDHIQLISTTEDDEEFNNLFSEYSELQNLSELRLHPHKLPLTQSFRIEFENILIGEIGFKSIRWYNRKAERSCHKKRISRKGNRPQCIEDDNRLRIRHDEFSSA